MAKISRLRVLTEMIGTGLVPLFYHSDVEVAARIVEACLEGGVRCIEFTNRGDRANLVFQALIERFEDDDRLILGVGSVMDAPTAALYIQLGANFVVSPVLNPEMARICNRRKIPFSPGCATTSEISAAEELGVEIVKIFPGTQVGGPAFVKAVRAPMPWTSIMPTGGVSPTEENLRAWFEAGAACVGMGSKLIRKDLVEAGNFDEITRMTAQALARIRGIREEHPLT